MSSKLIFPLTNTMRTRDCDAEIWPQEMSGWPYEYPSVSTVLVDWMTGESGCGAAPGREATTCRAMMFVWLMGSTCVVVWVGGAELGWDGGASQRQRSRGGKDTLVCRNEALGSDSHLWVDLDCHRVDSAHKAVPVHVPRRIAQPGPAGGAHGAAGARRHALEVDCEPVVCLHAEGEGVGRRGRGGVCAGDALRHLPVNNHGPRGVGGGGGGVGAAGEVDALRRR